MALPPEQINIKRRREEEPVETLCRFLPPVLFFPCAFSTPQFYVQEQHQYPTSFAIAIFFSWALTTLTILGWQLEFELNSTICPFFLFFFYMTFLAISMFSYS
jgi:hypothetical protein